MKVRLNKKVLAEMDPRVREIVEEWKARTHRNIISVENVTVIPAREDAHLTFVNLFTGDTQTERVAGEYAGLTRLSPTADIPLPRGFVAVETSIFLGQHYLTIYQGSNPQLT